MACAEPVAYGKLALKPREFERLQPHEYYALYDGYRFREEREKEKRKDDIVIQAHFTAYLMNCFSKKTIYPKYLYKPLLDAMSGGKKRSVQDRKQDEEYLRRIFDLPPEGVKEDG